MTDLTDEALRRDVHLAEAAAAEPRPARGHDPNCEAEHATPCRCLDRAGRVESNLQRQLEQAYEVSAGLRRKLGEAERERDEARQAHANAKWFIDGQAEEIEYLRNQTAKPGCAQAHEDLATVEVARDAAEDRYTRLAGEVERIVVALENVTPNVVGNGVANPVVEALIVAERLRALLAATAPQTAPSEHDPYNCPAGWSAAQCLLDCDHATAHSATVTAQPARGDDPRFQVDVTALADTDEPAPSGEGAALIAATAAEVAPLTSVTAQRDAWAEAAVALAAKLDAQNAPAYGKALRAAVDGTGAKEGT